MKIFFTASYSGKKEYQKVYDFIVDLLKKDGHEVIGLEVMNYEELLGKNLIGKIRKKWGKEGNARVHSAYNRKAVDIADAVIIEASTEKYLLGYESRLALDYNKPVLAISDKKDYKEKIDSPMFYAVQYKTHKELTTAIRKYLKKVKASYLSVRTHFNLTPKQDNFLKWVAKKEGSNKSEFVRGLIDREIGEYKDYLDDYNRILPQDKNSNL